MGFYADVVADALTLPACPDQRTAYSILEALRMAAAQVLDMTMDDLQVLVIGHVDRDEVDAVLWDPMPGGSGLLDQLCTRFPEIIAAAKSIVDGCPSACSSACIDCLQTFRNSFYHKHLDRQLVSKQLTAWGDKLSASHQIPPKQPAQPAAEASQPANNSERHLQYLLQAAGFEDGIRGEQLRLGQAIGTTTPDIIYRTVDHAPDEGICIYLDGLSQHLHGNPARAEHDRQIRDWLRNNGYEVIEIAVSDLTDEAAMVRHFRKLAGYLNKPELRERLRADTRWYHTTTTSSPTHQTQPRATELRLVQPRPEQRYVNCLPLIPLKAAAGTFSDPQFIPNDADWDNWVAVDIGRKLHRGMFVAKVTGKSMEPRIPDDSWCIFSTPITGSRNGRILLIQLQQTTDPETNARYTVKRYESTTTPATPNTPWRHLQITLHPLNRDYQPIILTAEDEGQVTVIAEFVQRL